MTEPAPANAPHGHEFPTFPRALGIILVGLGVILTVVGAVSLVSSWGTIGGSRYFWAAYLGLPLIALGSVLTQSRNLSADRLSTSGDRNQTVNDGVSAASGQTPLETTIDCQRCHAPNPGDAKFCNQCGNALKASACPECGAEVTPNARFCNQCGKSLA
jgi:ribosomal protein L40E